MESFDEQPPDREVRGRSGEHWVVLAVSVLGVAVVVALGLLLDPDERGFGTHEQLGFRPCFPLVAWDLPCPGCGVTTAVTYAAHGDLVASIRTQPFGFALVAGALVFLGWALVQHLRGRDLWLEVTTRLRASWLQAALALFLAAWVYKTGVVRGWF